MVHVNALGPAGGHVQRVWRAQALTSVASKAIGATGAAPNLMAVALSALNDTARGTLHSENEQLTLGRVRVRRYFARASSMRHVKILRHNGGQRGGSMSVGLRVKGVAHRDDGKRTCVCRCDARAWRVNVR